MEEMEIYEEYFKVTFTDIPIRSHLEGVIVEPRCHKHLSLVLKNFRYMMPEWCMTIYHSKENEGFINEILGDNHTAKMICVSDGNMTIEDYSKLLLSKSFWQNMRGEKIMIFQCDSFIRKRCIAPFLGYDYVGAPWTDDFLTIGIERDGKTIFHKVIVGNGGLSLRTRSIMLRIINLTCMDQYRQLPEDVFFSIGMLILTDVRRCPPEIARSFSVETVYHNNPFGWHKAYAYWKDDRWNTIKTIPSIQL